METLKTVEDFGFEISTTTVPGTVPLKRIYGIGYLLRTVLVKSWMDNLEKCYFKEQQ